MGNFFRHHLCSLIQNKVIHITNTLETSKPYRFYSYRQEEKLHVVLTVSQLCFFPFGIHIWKHSHKNDISELVLRKYVMTSPVTSLVVLALSFSFCWALWLMLIILALGIRYRNISMCSRQAWSTLWDSVSKTFP